MVVWCLQICSGELRIRCEKPGSFWVRVMEIGRNVSFGGYPAHLDLD